MTTLSKERENQGVTLEKMSDHLNLSVEQLARVEDGQTSDITCDALEAYAKVLGKIIEVKISDTKEKSKGITDDNFQITWEERYDAIDSRIQSLLKEKFGSDNIFVEFIIDEDDDGLPVDNLDKVAVEGKVQFHHPKDKDNDWVEVDWKSPVLENPTHLELTLLANEMMIVTKDHHHCVFEGTDIIHREGEVQIAKFIMYS